MQYHSKPLFVSAEGGTLDVIDKSGRVVASVPVRPGIVPRSEFAALEPFGEFRLSKGLSEVLPSSGYAVQAANERFASGANPDYQPPSQGEKLHRDLRVMMSRLAKQEHALESRLRAAERLREMPEAPKALSEVVEFEAEAPAGDDDKQ